MSGMQEVFPANEKDRLEDLHHTIALISAVLEFQQQVWVSFSCKYALILSFPFSAGYGNVNW